MKRLFDLFFAIIILACLLPLFFIAMLAVMISIGWPIFFCQLRPGLYGRPFKMIKFRTMTNKFSANGELLPDVDRLTPVGRLLRSFSMDEMPELWNVIKGDMSLVGPRPHMVKHTDDFSKVVDHYMLRQFLKPGITGWAQINGYRGEIAHPDQIKDRVSSDLWYLEHWTVWLDLRIIFLTVFKVFAGDKNAY